MVMSQICLCYRIFHSDLSHSGITRMLYLRVWFVRVGDGIDLPKLEMVAFGNSTFIQSENTVFRSGFVSVW